jgi:hypothetical protein
LRGSGSEGRGSERLGPGCPVSTGLMRFAPARSGSGCRRSARRLGSRLLKAEAGPAGPSVEGRLVGRARSDGSFDALLTFRSRPPLSGRVRVLDLPREVNHTYQGYILLYFRFAFPKECALDNH